MHHLKFKVSFQGHMLYPLVCLIGIILLDSCSESKSDQLSKALVIENVNLISMESDQIVPNQSIIIVDDLIDAIGHYEKIEYPKGSMVINAKGKFLIPGLSDMHVHIDHPDVLKVNLAFGITTIMNYRGLPEHLILRELASDNKIFSPNIYTTGDYMEGYPATVPGFLSFDNSRDARKSVEEQKDKGYDFIKVYRNLDTLMHRAICNEASKNQLTVVGHLSPDISLQQSLAAGQKVISHAEELMYFFDNENDTTRIDELNELLNEYDITFTPNLTIFRSLPLQVQKLDSINSQPFVKYLQPALYQSWRKEFNFNHSRGEEWALFMWDRFRFLQKVTTEIHNAGVQLLASTDAPTSGAFPGIALHNELKEFVEIGLSPYEALKTATVEPGKFIKKHVKNSRDFGLIKKGYRADLLILDKNPLEDIQNTRMIHGLIKNGYWYPRDSLEMQLADLYEVYKKIDPLVKSIEEAIENQDIDLARDIFAQGKANFEDQSFLGYYTMWYAGYRFLYENRKLTDNPDRAEKAAKFYTMYLDQYPEMHGSHYLLGMAFKAQKDTLNAIKSFEESLKLHPFNPYARNQINLLRNK